MKKLTLKSVLPMLLLLVSSIIDAQSLPNVQKTSLRSPGNIKVDGKAAEWGNKFQAYNKATDIFYTLSNNDETLYLTVQAKYHDVFDKILRGGLTFTINHTLSKRDPAHVSVTYPVLRGADMAAVTNLVVHKIYPLKNGETSSIIKIDDLNALMDAKSKVINICGIKAIPDDAISVYNTDGIKAVSQFDDKIIYTYELAIPLKYLELPNNGSEGFSYNIKINEPSNAPVSHNGPPPPPMAMSTLATTDFWGEYVLAKK
jgi:hypothetical protein